MTTHSKPFRPIIIPRSQEVSPRRSTPQSEESKTTKTTPRNSILSIPYDEKNDSVSVNKGLKVLQRHTNPDTTALFQNLPPRDSFSLIGEEPETNAKVENDNLTQTLVEDGATSIQLEPVRSRRDEVIRNQDDGCYLIYDCSSGGELRAHFSHNGVPKNAVGFWSPNKHSTIEEYKYRTHDGCIDLIGGIVGGEKHHRRKYLEGWCMFIDMAKRYRAKVKMVSNPQQGMRVDVYGFSQGRVFPLEMEDKLVDVQHLEAVTVVPHYNDRFKGVHTLSPLTFLEQGNLDGASLKLHE